MADIDTSKITPLRPFTDEEALAWLRERGKLTIAGAQLARQWGWGERKAQRKLDDWKSDGLIKRDNQVRLLRDNTVVFTGKIASLRRFKDDASQVSNGMECGISIANYGDIKVGDVIEAFVTERIAAEAIK